MWAGRGRPDRPGARAPRLEPEVRAHARGGSRTCSCRAAGPRSPAPELRPCATDMERQLRRGARAANRKILWRALNGHEDDDRQISPSQWRVGYEGTVLEWLKAEGDPWRPTRGRRGLDRKGRRRVPAPASGVLNGFSFSPRDVPTGTVLGEIEVNGADPAATGNGGARRPREHPIRVRRSAAE